MSMEFELKVSEKDMSKFLLRFNYTRLSGLLGILLGVASLAALVIRWGAWTDNQKIMLVIIAVLFLVFQPFMLIKKAKAQVAQTKEQDALVCHIDEEQISVSQGEAVSSCPWSRVRKIVYGKNAVYVFTTTIHATIITKEACSERFEELVMFLKEKKRK